MKVSLKMYLELWALGIQTPACAFFFVDEEVQRIILYVAFPNPRKAGLSWTHPDMQEVDEDTAVAKMDVPITDDWAEDLDYWRRGEVWYVTRTYEEDLAVLQPFHDYFGLDGKLPAIGPEWIVNNVPFKYGWVSVRYKEDLTQAALHMALRQRRPPAGLMHHSDRGRQYAGRAYRGLLRQHRIRRSMSRKGNCWDNAPMESFIATLKTELIHHPDFHTRQEARQALFEYIEVFYNRQRTHSALGYKTPVQYEQQFESSIIVR